MTANGQAVAVTPADSVRDRLDDPQVAAALNTLLDHADVLAVLVSGLDGFVRRGDTITETVSSAVAEFRGASRPASRVPTHSRASTCRAWPRAWPRCPVRSSARRPRSTPCCPPA